MREEGFLVDNNNDPVPGNISHSNAVPMEMKENRLSLDQEWGWDNTCHRQKSGSHHTDAKVKDHTKQDLIDYGFLEAFWSMFPETYFYLTIVKSTSAALAVEGH